MENVFAAVLAGGMGTRMGNPDKPKQFWDLAGKPVIVHTVEKFCLVNDFAKVIVPVPETWVNQTRDVMARYLPAFTGKIDVIAGGEDRNGSIMNAIAHIEQLGALDDDWGWSAARWQDALNGFFDEHEEILIDADARSARFLEIDESAERSERIWRVRQIFLDSDGDLDFRIEADLDLDATQEEGQAVFANFSVGFVEDFM